MPNLVIVFFFCEPVGELSSGRQQVDERDFTALKVMLFDRPANGLPVTGDQASVSR
jgi:hypothetical protein